ncbi:tetratricopeptide repeat protein [Niveispirillum sp.]|uniref:tetratricopeptide repeat protein n=1 Tax=Niveispirillum sp. TaxID=1917217 RepID=UPI001B3F3CA9|nr:tetratricopeptide repeat protein [Niveispirillum sp.]MBP7335129.1 tetratricopeptide repeat protein [Niveispirillum sp.]
MQKVGVSQNMLAELNAAKQLHMAGKIAEAETRYRTLLARNPNLHDALHPLGIALQQLGRHAEAEAVISRWLVQSPRDYDALVNQGNSLSALGRPAEAGAAYQKALAVRPQSGEVRCFLANTQYMQGDVARAEENYRLALKDHPTLAVGLFNLANLLCDTGRAEEGIRYYEEVLRHHPDMIEAMVNLGNQFAKRGRGEEALKLLREAVRKRPTMPEALVNLGIAIYDQEGDLEGAEHCFAEAVKVAPTYRDALNNLTNIYMNQGRLDESEQLARRMLELFPDNPTVHGTAAGLFLVAGKLLEGWGHFEWRWLRPNLPVPLRDFGKPEWRGEDISTKTILLHHEQGLGDSIQFVRFAAIIAARAGKVILEVPPNLRALYSCLEQVPGVTLAIYGEPLPPFDVHLAIMSVPHVLGITLDNIPAPIPYLFADPERVEMWRDRLPKGEFRIGVVWQGKAGIGVDRGRSYGLRHLAPIARIPGVTLVSLQKGYGLDQLDHLPDGMQVVSLGPDFDSGPGAFLDTAAVMQHMDLIISSDTSVAHLAGALGRPVWVPLKFAPDWRWLMEREDSPWYPTTMRLFRQRRNGGWDGVFERLAEAVAALKTGDRSMLLPPPAPPSRPSAEVNHPVPPPPLPPDRPAIMLASGEIHQTGSDTVRETVTRYGTLRHPARDPVIGRSLEAYGEWMEAELAACLSVLNPGDVVVEAGANIGTHALPLARHFTLHLFEGQPALRGLLADNLAANQIGSATLHEGDGTAIDSLNLPRLRLIKAALEGREVELLRGAADTIARCRPYLYLRNDRPERETELVSLLRSLGYRMWSHRPRLFNPGNFRGEAQDFFGPIGTINLLCAPQEKDCVVVGLPLVT